MPASRSISQRQLEVLLAIAEANKDVALGRCSRGPQGNQMTQRAWESVSIRLNSVAVGISKTAEQWRRYWVEWKAKTKAKGADIRRNASKRGGGPNNLKPLNELEERILQLIGRVCVEGLPGVRIPCPIPSETLVVTMLSQPRSQASTSQATPSTSQIEVEWLEEDYSVPSPVPLTSQTGRRIPCPIPSETSVVTTLSQPSTSQASTSQATPSTSQIEVEWIEEENEVPSPVPLTSQTGRPPPTIQPSPPPQSSPPDPVHTTPISRQSTQPAQPSPRLRSRQRLIRNRDVPQWASSLEERRLAIEEMHARALEALSVTLDRRLGNIEDRLREISEKLGNST